MTGEDLLDSGQSDSNPSSNTLSDILDTATKLGTAGAAAYRNITGSGSNPTAANTQARAAAAPVDWKKYLPWGIGAVVLLIVLGIVFRRK